jgi:DNA invertase Pin-like site-specific DNA recombinase
MPNYAIYARVSTRDQDYEMQVKELREVADKQGWTITKTITETVSGAKGRSDRKGLDELMRAISQREIDGVLVWHIDRIGRSLSNVVNVLDTISQKKVHLYIHKSNIDTNTPEGRAMIQMVATFAEYERAIIARRVRSGLETAKAKGIKLGRPKKTKPTKKDIRIENALKQGYSVTQTQIMTKSTRGTVSRIRQRLNADGQLPTNTMNVMKVGTYSTKNIGTTTEIGRIDLNKVDIEDVKEAFSKRAKSKPKGSKVA